LYVCHLSRAPRAPRRGVGRALIAAVARQGRARERTFLWWASKPWNEDAQAFYAALGVTTEPVLAHALTFADFDKFAK
jgi:ribosomal protein S18 acetylase RimI-like enzyme